MMSTHDSPLRALTAQNYETIVRDTIRRKTGASENDVSTIRVSGSTVTERLDTNGYLGAYYKLVVTIDPTTPCSEDSSFVYFVKTLPLSNPDLMKLMRETGMADREHRSYTSLLPSLDSVPKLLKNTESKFDSWHPHCYYRNEDLLILEDLFDEGYTHFPDGEQFPVEYNKSALRTLATMHAASLAYEAIVLKGPKLNEAHSDLLVETSFVPNNAWFNVGLDTIKEMVPLLPNFKQDYADRWCPAAFLKCLYQVYDEIKPSKEYTNVLSHQDLWKSNILFRADSSSLHAKLIDFQGFRYLPPVMDILQMLQLTTRRSHRTEHLNEYLKSYHQELSDELTSYGLRAEEILPLQELLTSSRKLRLQPLVNAAFLLPWILMPPNTVNDLKRDNYDAYVHMAYVRRVEFVVSLMETHLVYREIVEESVDDLAQFVYGGECYRRLLHN